MEAGSPKTTNGIVPATVESDYIMQTAFFHYTGSRVLAPSDGIRYLGAFATGQMQSIVVLAYKNEKALLDWASQEGMWRVPRGTDVVELASELRMRNVSECPEHFVSEARRLGLLDPH